MPRVNLIQARRDTAANWTSVNPTLAAGETGFETDTGKHKIGTGSAAWTALPYSTLLPTGGTTGQVLAKSSATDYATEWITPAAPALALTLLSSTTFTAQTIVDVNDVFSSTYDQYLVLANGVKNTNDGNISMTFVNDSTPAASQFGFNHWGLTGSATTANGFNAGTDAVIADTTCNSNQEFYFRSTITDVFKTTRTLAETTTYSRVGTGGNNLSRMFLANLNNTTSYEGLRLQTANASITGSLRIYGIGK
jgi:hypothetical protein